MKKSKRDAAAQPGPTPMAVQLPNSDQSVNDQQKQSSILVGIDWADKTHAFHLIDPAGVTASGNLVFQTKEGHFGYAALISRSQWILPVSALERA